MSIQREVTLEWKGQEYKVIPTNRLLRQIEGEGVSIAAVISQVGNGQPQVSLISFIVAKLIQSAGGKVTEDEIYDEIMGDLEQGKEKEFLLMTQKIAEAMSPTGLKGKKPEAQSETKPKSTPGKSKK